MDPGAEFRELLLRALRLCTPDDGNLNGDILALQDKLRMHCCLKDCSEDLSSTVEDVLRRDFSRGARVTDELALTPFSRVGSTAVSIWRGDITRLAIDAIVNPASHPYLMGCYEPRHPCMDQAIHAAAGPRLRHACKALFPLHATMDGRRCTRTRALPNSTKVGDVHMTSAFCLPCKHILHATGPFNVHAPAVSPTSSSSSSSGPTQLQLLQQTYVHILEEADRHSLKSVALACLSTGKFGFSTDLACLAALRTVKSYLESNPTGIRHVVFQVYMAIDEAMYGILGPWVFGVSSETGSGVTDSSAASAAADDESWEIWDDSIRQQIDLVKNRRRRRGRATGSTTISTIPPLSVLQSLHYPYQMGSCEVEEEDEEEEEEDKEQEEELEARLELLASESTDGATSAVSDMLLLAALGDFVGLQRALEEEKEREVSLTQEQERNAELERERERASEMAREREREAEREKEKERDRELIRERERNSERQREAEREKAKEREREREREAQELPHASPQDLLESQISLQALATARAQVQARRSQLAAALRAEARERLRMAEEDEESEVTRAEERLEVAQRALQVEMRAREERALAVRLAREGQEAERREREAAAEARRAADQLRRAAEAAEALRLRELQAEEERERERVRAREAAEEAARKHKLALIASRRMDLEKEMLKVQLQSMAAHGEEEQQELLRLQGAETFRAIAAAGASDDAVPALAPVTTASQPSTPTAAAGTFSPPRTAIPPTPPPLFSHSSPPPFYSAPPNKPSPLPPADRGDMLGILRQQQALLAQQQEELGVKRNKRREALKKERGEGEREREREREKDDEAEEAAEEEAEIRRLEERMQERARQATRSKMLEDKEREMELEMERERQAAERAAADSAIAVARIRQLEEDKAREHAAAELRIRQLMEEKERERQAAERASREAEAALARIQELELEMEKDRAAAEKAAVEALAQAQRMRDVDQKQRERERIAAERNALVVATETARIRELEERLLERERAGVAKAAVEAAARLAKIKQIEERQLERERQAAEQAAEQAALAAARIKQIEDKQRERIEEEEGERERIKELERQRQRDEAAREAAQLSAKMAAQEDDKQRIIAAEQQAVHKSVSTSTQAIHAVKIQRLFRRRHRRGVDLSVSSRLAQQTEAAAHSASSNRTPTETLAASPAVRVSLTQARSPSSGYSVAATPPSLGRQSSPTTPPTPPSSGLISPPMTQDALFFRPPAPRRASAPGNINSSGGSSSSKVSSLNETPPSTPLSTRAIDTGTQTPEWSVAPPPRLSLYEKSPDEGENADASSSDVSSDESFFVPGTVRAEETRFDSAALSGKSLDFLASATSASISSHLDATDSPRRRSLVPLPSQRRRGRPSTPHSNRVLAPHSYYAYEDSSSSGGDDNIDVSDFASEQRGIVSLPAFPHGYDFSASTWREVVQDGEEGEGPEGAEGAEGAKNRRVSFLLQGTVFFGGDESARAAEQRDKESDELERKGLQEVEDQERKGWQDQEREREERRRRRRRREKQRSDDAWAQQHERLSSPRSPSSLGTIVLETVAAIPWIGGLLGGGGSGGGEEVDVSEAREAARSYATAAELELERLQHQRDREEVRAREKLRERELAHERQQREGVRESESDGDGDGVVGSDAQLSRRLPLSPIYLAYTTTSKTAETETEGGM